MPSEASGGFAALHAYWRAANYLSVGQLYLAANPLLREPLLAEHVKPRLLGHWGTAPGINLVHAHLNRVIRERDLDALLVTGPGHGGAALLANSWLDGSYTERFPSVTRDAAGMARLFRQYSFPGGVPSHAAPSTPGSIHEGGELGYSLAHAFGAVLDSPDLLAVCIVGDGEAETGPLAGSWSSTRFLDARTDGAVLPVLHLNGWKIANPSVLARIPERDLLDLLRGHGYAPVVVSGHDPAEVHPALAGALDDALDLVAGIQHDARSGVRPAAPPRWPMIVLRTPKGWTGPAVVDGVRVEGTFRSHQLPLARVREDPSHLALLDAWLRTYRPDELFDPEGRPRAEIADVAPLGTRRLGLTPRANGGTLLRDLDLPGLRPGAVTVTAPATTQHEPTRVLGRWLRNVVADNADRFRIVGPDEIASNRLDAVFEVTGRQWAAAHEPDDDHLAPSGQVLEVLSEHLCQGWLEGYLLTGRHGLFTSYEGFTTIVDSMASQHAKWLTTAAEVPWRAPIASLNYLLTSHVWRQDHNGFSHQDPGFIDHMVNKRPEVVRVFLPPDANTLLVVADHCLRSRGHVNVVVAGKQPVLDLMDLDTAVGHCERGVGVLDWAGTDGGEPDVVLACAGDVPTLETLAAAQLLRELLPTVRVRVVNVVDLMRLAPPSEHPHGLPDAEFDALFTRDRPVVFAHHGYPWLIHRLTYRRAVHHNLHVRGYREQGTTTTPFDMVALNDLDRFHLVMDVVDRVPRLRERAVSVRQLMADRRSAARRHTREHGIDAPEVADWAWTGTRP